MDPKWLAMRVAGSPKFTGSSHENLGKWLSHFELRFRDVPDEDLAKVLIDLLDGTALDLCTRLSKKELTDYETIKKALQSRFGEETVALQAYAELSQATQKPGESAEEFGDRILELAGKAYPGASLKQKQDSSLKQFICGLTDGKLQGKLIARDDVNSMEDAIQVAKSYRTRAGILEAMRNKTESGVAMTAQRVQCIPTSEAAVSKDAVASISEMKAQLEGIQKAITQLEARVSQGASRERNFTAQKRCFQCGETSHFRRQCPQLKDMVQDKQQNVKAGSTASQHPRAPFCVGCGRHGHWMAECWRVPTPPTQPRFTAGVPGGRGVENQGNE